MSSMQLEPGAILASPQGRGTITIVSVDACVTALVDDHVWIWPRRSTERTLSGMGFALVGEEDPDVLAERVRLADSRARRRFDNEDSASAQGGAA